MVSDEREKEFTAYISKYALTTGIYERRVKLCGEYSMVQALGGKHSEFYHGEGREWHRTRAGAVERAEVMRENKLRSIQKQNDRILALVFDA